MIRTDDDARFAVPLPLDVKAVMRQGARPFTPADEFVQVNLTTVIFTSPVPSHPSTWLLENVYDSIRYHLPNMRIVVLADGTDGDEPGSYVEFKNQARRKGWELLAFKGRHLQSLMLREALLNVVKTPLVMVAEGDWGLRKLYVDWCGIAEVLLDPTCRYKLVQLRQDRLGDWELTSRDHSFGALECYHGVNLLPTTWFQCPTHVANSDWYRRLVPFMLTPQFLERDELTEGMRFIGALDEMACYIPPGPMMGRCYHLDGRNVVNIRQADGLDYA
jgi:hypothetical protein